jgi:RNA polymerase sigma-70 factor (ECF subfamily)
VKTRRGELVPLRRVDGDPREMSDEALVAACAVEEPAALGALFDRHHGAVYRFVARLAGAGDCELDDLVQLTFLEAWKSSAHYTSRGSARSWLFGIAANVVRHHIRGEARRRAAMRGLAEVPPHHARRPDDDAVSNELVDRLATALPKLPHDLRVAFVLCDLEHVSGVEAARLLGVREGTMWRRLHDARKRLRRSLEGRP